MLNRLAIILLFIGIFALTIWAQNDSSYRLDADSMRNEGISFSQMSWKYHAGDKQEWAAKDFDDGDWKSLTNKQINDDLTTLENWEGRAWFRKKITVDERLANQSLAFLIWNWGAAEIYLDGELIKSFGEIKQDGETEYNQRGLAFPVVFKSGGEHTLAVRYSFTASRDLTRNNWLIRGGTFPGFNLYVESWEKNDLRTEDQMHENRVKFTFIGLFAALALVHFLLYIFYRAALSNLFYSFFVAGLAATFFLQNLFGSAHFSAAASLVTNIVRLNIQGLAVISLLAFLYIEFINRFSKFFWLLLGLWAIGFGLNAAQIWNNFSYILILLFITFADCLRIMFQALKNRRDGAWIIGTGIFTIVFGVTLNISQERQWLILPEWLYLINLYLSVLSVPLTVSVYLARNFARTNRQLEFQLEQVKELSALQIESERRAADLRAENERRAKELEEARQLQISMLPKKLPQLPNLEIAAYMKPATEVGGDYYDFHVGKDGTLTVAVGDATGHGLKAGTMVTATKSLFNNFADAADIPDTLQQISRSLKAMNLRGLFMALTLIKLKDYNLSICAAGMPSTLVYHAADNTVEEISIRAVPLGSLTNFKYQKQELVLQKGDCVIVLSDGFPEMFNAENEILGFDKASEVLQKNAGLSAREIINHLIKTGENWANGRPQDDDVTFVVLKFGDNRGNNEP